ncbi:hypothetical protein GLOIN_2v1536279 [Rhizophagus irregularis DAOM 181602=DAOM 197198]|uniref:Uncharacterized protein n=1 Tax=Rhizophagus irregularis (strain DAOM 181602 / DAOM 197198 / MUCL 43194) TaxID=747089 RepID=A0A2P4QLZ7_RHIID|nr:hypothetical protein GLOIN_2v1536279 [Rhizophagus irregularis DAOM 181602=DAOM 197198]POG78654.1 hypothetical protein GLOIN_2v1536279 [Rhizophagus irregularis DAOM 181602=DAOM 197198]|eukprot:XP_025185520.1 hypothetical protein GLOIN_2v1536279 [Rhizophagus irregularis DAOM 181602=DAOM 197198]
MIYLDLDSQLIYYVYILYKYNKKKNFIFTTKDKMVRFIITSIFLFTAINKISKGVIA